MGAGLLSFLLLTLPAQAAELVAVDTEDAAAVTDFLSLPEGEAAILIYARGGLDLLRVDGHELAHPASGSWAVRGLREGFVRVEVEHGDRRWEGTVRTVALTAVPWDAEEALASPQATPRDRPVPLDVFAFYEELDQTYDPARRKALCEAWRGRARPGDEARVLERACAAPAPLPPSVKGEGNAVPELDAELDEEVGTSLTAQEQAQRILLYDKDGHPRREPRGTPVRAALIAAGVVGTGGFLLGGLLFEAEAERIWSGGLVSERFGDDAAWTVALLHTRDLDRKRDASVTASALCLTGTVTAILAQRWEKDRLRALRIRAGIRP
jgi:hypothetical protein